MRKEKKSRGETHGSRLNLNAREANVFLDTEACSKIFGTDASGINPLDGTATLPGKDR